MKTQTTTIKLQRETKERLEKLKEHPRETADQLLKKILWILSMTRNEPAKAQEVLDRVDELRKRWVGKKGGEGKWINLSGEKLGQN